MNGQESQQQALNPQPFSSFDFMKSRKLMHPIKTSEQNNNHKFLGLSLISAFSSVVISQLLVSYTVGRRLFQNLYEKGSKTEEKKSWVNRQMKHLLKTMIRYNSIVFGSKVLLDNYYAETMRKNELYYQSNSSLHFKIGALVGLTTYFITIPINQFQSIKALSRSSSNFLSVKPKNRIESLKMTSQQFFSLPAIKRMFNQFNFSSFLGVVCFRTIYFGGYEKIKSKYEGPLNQYVIAPIVCSSLSLIVAPFDQIKLLQLTSDKGKSFLQLLNEKGFKLWNLSGQKIYTAVAKQSIAMSLFVASQNIIKYVAKIKNQVETLAL